MANTHNVGSAEPHRLSIHPNVPQSHLQAVLLGYELELGGFSIMSKHEEQQTKVCSSIGNSEKVSGATGFPFVKISNITRPIVY